MAKSEHLLEVEISIIGLLEFILYSPPLLPKKHLRQFAMRYTYICSKNLKIRVKKVKSSRSEWKAEEGVETEGGANY